MKIQFLIMLLIASIASYSQADSTKIFIDSTANKKILYEGTVITIKLLDKISSEESKKGEMVEFEVSEPVIIGDRVFIAKGAKVFGQITEAEKRKGLGKAGKLSFSVNYLQLPSGKNVSLTSEVSGKGKAKVGPAIAEAVLLTPLFLLKKGKKIKFDKGDIFKVFVEKDTEL